MARPRSPVPRYTLHKSSGQARVCFGGREIYLGVYGSPESRAEYARIVAELQAGSPAEVAPPACGPVVDEVVLAFWKHAEQHYRRPDDTPTNELVEYRCAIKPLRELYGHTPAAAFGPLALRAVRQKMIDTGNCRTTINNRVRRLKHLFKWRSAASWFRRRSTRPSPPSPGYRRAGRRSANLTRSNPSPRTWPVPSCRTSARRSRA